MCNQNRLLCEGAGFFFVATTLQLWYLWGIEKQDDMQSDITTRLVEHNLRITSTRKEVLGLFMNAKGKALANKDLENDLHDTDRITLYRTLKAFEESGLIHRAVDSSGTTKYALCEEHCTAHHHHDEHAHFHCLTCGKTECLEGSIQPQVKMPTGYEVRNAHLVLEGTCSECQ